MFSFQHRENLEVRPLTWRPRTRCSNKDFLTRSKEYTVKACIRPLNAAFENFALLKKDGFLFLSTAVLTGSSCALHCHGAHLLWKLCASRRPGWTDHWPGASAIDDVHVETTNSAVLLRRVAFHGILPFGGYFEMKMKRDERLKTRTVGRQHKSQAKGSAMKMDEHRLRKEIWISNLRLGSSKSLTKHSFHISSYLVISCLSNI